MLAFRGSIGKRAERDGVPVWDDIAQSRSTMVQELHAWWIAHRGGAEMPDRNALWPGDILRLLPFLFIAELTGERVRYRLVGTKAVANTGFEFTGCYLDELQRGGSGVPWEDYYRRVLETRRPLLGAVTVPAEAGGTFQYEFGIYPLTLGGTEIRQFIAVEDYFGFDSRSAQWIR
jgi:hypothetical protein